jgi:phenylalanine 2-monooxygenase
VAVTVIKNLAQAAATMLREAPTTIGELANGPGLSYRHPDSAQISYPRAVQTALGSVPAGRTVVAIIGAGPGGIAALYELRQLADLSST